MRVSRYSPPGTHRSSLRGAKWRIASESVNATTMGKLGCAVATDLEIQKMVRNAKANVDGGGYIPVKKCLKILKSGNTAEGREEKAAKLAKSGYSTNS